MWYPFIHLSLSLTCDISLSSSSSTNLVISIYSLVFYTFIYFRVFLTLLKAVTLILKHATSLRTSISAKSALANAELNYQNANIDVTIQEHITACASDQSVEQFVGFVMSTEIGLFIFFYLSHHYLVI